MAHHQHPQHRQQQQRRNNDASSISEMSEEQLTALIVRCLEERGKVVDKWGWIKSNVGTVITVLILAATVIAANVRLGTKVDALVEQGKETNTAVKAHLTDTRIHRDPARDGEAQANILSRLNSIDEKLNRRDNAR